MAKKQLKKINQPKKYLQGGSNLGSVSQIRQNPYYIGQLGAEDADQKYQNSQDQLAQARLDAAQAQKDSRDMQNQQLDQTIRNNTSNLVKATATDQKAGNLGKFLIKSAPTTIGNTNPFAFMQAPAQSIGTGTAIEGIGVLAPEYMPAAQAGLGTAVDAGVGVLAPEFIAPAADAGNVVANTATTGLSSLATAGIGAAAAIGGKLIQKRADDNSAYTFTDKERRGNVGGSALASAGTGFGIGNMLLPGVGGAIGAGIGAGVGALKARKENKAAQEEADRLQREQAAMRGAYQSAFVNSRLTGADTGFGLNSSTNMNNQFTNQFQVAKTGGVKRVPGGQIVPIEGTDAVEFKGKSHENGGVTIDKNTEVEGGETMDQVAMSNNNKQDYIFSKYLKLGGKSFAQRHKEILKGSGSQADIQQLAAMQEKVAGRNPQQVAAYGGFHKYVDGGAVPDCPPGMVYDVATGQCVPDEDSGSNSYDWNATGLEGFKAKQQSAAPAATVKQEPEKPAEPILYFNDKNKKYTYRDEKGKKLMSGSDQNRLSNQMNAQRPGATGFDQQLANIEKRETLGVKPPVDEQTTIAAQNTTPTASANAVVPTSKPKGWGAAGSPSSQIDVDQPAYTVPTAPTATVNPGVQPPTNTQPVATTTPASAATNTGTSTAATYTTPTGITPSGNQQSVAKTDNTVAPDATLNTAISTSATSASTNVKGANAPNATSSWDTQKASLIDEINASPDALIDPAYKGRLIANLNSPDPKVRDQAMYDFNIHSVTQVGQDVDPKASPAVPYSSAPGVAAPFGPTQTGTTTGTSTDPTVTYVNSNDPNAPVVAQTPEEIETARLAGLPRIFSGASRKVDEATGNVTVDKGKLLMGVGAMAGSRLGTAAGSQEDLAKIINNSYDQAWTNKADNLYTDQKDAGGGGLSSSDAIADRNKIAESNWGQKYGYKKGMSADEAKAAHGKFATDVKSLFANNPDEILGYFQYIVDGGDASKLNYLGKDAEQIKNNLKTKGFIGADGRPVIGKEKEMAAYLETQATNNAVGPIHNALGSYTAERTSSKIKLEEQKKKKDEIVTQELPKKYEPCPPGTYRSGDGTCKPVGDVPQGNKINATVLAGLGQLIPVGAALANPYKIAPGIIGAPAIKGALMPRVNLNQERASNIQQNVAYKNAVVNQNAGPGALAAMQMANTKTNDQMLKIAQQEQDSNRQLASEEGKMGMQASMFNAETDQKRQMFNTEFNQKERQYRREDILGALDAGASRIAGIVKDDRAFKADERLATALDETGSYDRFSILEQLNKEAKRKNSPYYGTTEAERRRMAAAMHRELNPEGYVGKSEYTKLQEENAKMKKEQEENAKNGKAKFGGARQYVSRLGQLSGVRATKAKL